MISKQRSSSELWAARRASGLKKLTGLYAAAAAVGNQLKLHAKDSHMFQSSSCHCCAAIRPSVKLKVLRHAPKRRMHGSLSLAVDGVEPVGG